MATAVSQRLIGPIFKGQTVTAVCFWDGSLKSRVWYVLYVSVGVCLFQGKRPTILWTVRVPLTCKTEESEVIQDIQLHNANGMLNTDNWSGYGRSATFMNTCNYTETCIIQGNATRLWTFNRGEVGPQTQASVFITTTSAKCLYAATTQKWN